MGGDVGVGHAVSTTQVAVSASWARASGTRKSQASALQLVLAQAGPGHAQPDDHDRDGRRLEQRPERPEDVGEGAVPAAEEEHGEQQRHHHDAGVLGQQEEREAQPGVLGVGTEHDLGVGHRHVERRSLQLGHGGDQEAHGAGQLPQQPERVPRGGDAGQGHRARRPARPTPRTARSAARSSAAAPRRAAHRAGRTCWRWPTRPSGCRRSRRRRRRGRTTRRRRRRRRPRPATAGSPRARPGRAPAPRPAPA